MLHKNYKPYFKNVKKKKQKNLNILNKWEFKKKCSTNIYTIDYLSKNFITIKSCIKVIPIHQYILKRKKNFHLKTISCAKKISINIYKHLMSINYQLIH